MLMLARRACTRQLRQRLAAVRQLTLAASGQCTAADCMATYLAGQLRVLPRRDLNKGLKGLCKVRQPHVRGLQQAVSCSRAPFEQQTCKAQAAAAWGKSAAGPNTADAHHRPSCMLSAKLQCSQGVT